MYNYYGPAYRFDHYIGHFDVTTIAETPAQALNNITYRIKKQLNLRPNMRVTVDEDYLSEVNGQKISLTEPEKKEEPEAVQLSMFEGK